MCDTFINRMASGWLFGKNSDREPNEAQALEYIPEKNHEPGSNVDCTYITIPQVSRTRGVFLSRPFWMWGAEMGINDSGLVIGNEAVFTNQPYAKKDALTGMDLLRLALERCDSAEEAVKEIAGLIETYGQGGNCGYRNKSFYYHNSYIMADSKDAWVFETAGRYWVARRLKDSYAISNGLTLTDDYDLHSSGLHEHRSKKASAAIKKTGRINFTETFSDSLYTYFSACRPRRQRNRDLSRSGRADRTEELRAAIDRLRDHGGYENPMKGIRGKTICAHATNGLTRDAGQTTASMIVILEPGAEPEIWATATAAPCTGIFKPVVPGKQVPENVGTPGKIADRQSLWWRHELLHRQVIRDYPGLSPLIRKPLNELQGTFISEWDLHRKDSPEQKEDLSKSMFDRADSLLDSLTGEVTRQIEEHGTAGFSRYWKQRNKEAGIQW